MYKINSDISVKKIADELFIYDRKNAFIHSFNDTGAFILESIQEQMDPEQIIHRIVAEFDIEIDEARKDVAQFVDTLIKQNIIGKVS